MGGSELSRPACAAASAGETFGTELRYHGAVAPQPHRTAASRPRLSRRLVCGISRRGLGVESPSRRREAMTAVKWKESWAPAATLCGRTVLCRLPQHCDPG